MYDVIITGAGPAGLTAGIYAIRSGLNPLILDKGAWGGQTILSAEIENYPALSKVTGPDFAERLYRQLIQLGGQVKQEEVLCVDAEHKSVTTGQGTYKAKALILAAGLKRRTLGCKGEQRLIGRGVSYCAICDGRFFEGQKTAVAGGGNTAMEDALYLASLCTQVTILCRSSQFTGEEALKKQIDKTENIRVLYQVSVQEIIGTDTVEAVLLDNGQKIDTQALFVAIGYQADSSFLEGQIQLTDEGYIVAGEDCRTSAKGVFAAGDLRDKKVRQIVTAAADGAVAALGAADLIRHIS